MQITEFIVTSGSRLQTYLFALRCSNLRQTVLACTRAQFLAETSSSISAPAEYDAPHGTSQDHEVQPHRPVMHVVGIQFYPVGIVCVAPSADLPETRDPGPYALVHLIHCPVSGYLRIDYGPGTYQAHFSAQDIPQLRELVEAGLAQKTPDPGNAWIVAQLKILLPFGPEVRLTLQKLVQALLCVRVHRPELPAAEVFAPGSHAS